MSKRRWRSRAAAVVESSESEGEEEGLPPSKRSALSLQPSQSSQGAGSRGPRNALTALLAGSKPSGKQAAARPASRKAAAASGKAAAASKPGGSKAASGAAAARSTRSLAAKAATGLPAALPQQPPPAAAAAPPASELWVARHAPRTEAELVVHKKKVQEVQEWLERQRATLGQRYASRLLVLTGPPGSGKTTLLEVLGRAAGFELLEWQPPDPVAYGEAQYASSMGLQYKSKLAQFEEFVIRSKMPALTISRVPTGGGEGGGTAAGSGGGSGVQAGPTSPQQRQQQQRDGQQGQRESKAAGTSSTQQAAAAGARPKLVVVDDLPHAAGPEHRRQIATALSQLARSARFPLVVCATESSNKAQQERGLNAATGSVHGLHKELADALEACGATTISLNPLTTINLTKALHAALAAERRCLPAGTVEAIAEQANGDLHNALSTLQFVCTGAAAAAAPTPVKKGRGGGGRKKAGAAAGGGGANSGAAAVVGTGAGAAALVQYAGRDSMLTLFHALGKLLYNKRDDGTAPAHAGSPRSKQQQQQQQQQQAAGLAAEDGAGAGPASQQQQQQQQQPRWTANGFWQGAAGDAAWPEVPLAAWAQRRPMQFDPEAVLAGASLEAGSVAAFLHENLLDFVDEGHIGDVAGCLEHLSAADCLASGRRWGGTEGGTLLEEDGASSTLGDAAAASVAARGVCFSNSHPGPRRWLPLKAPALFAAQKAAAANRSQLARQGAERWVVHSGSGTLPPASQAAAELLPFVRSMQARTGDPSLQLLHPPCWLRFWKGQAYEQQQPQAVQAAPQQAGGGEELGGGSGVQVGGPLDAIENSTDEEDDW